MPCLVRVLLLLGAQAGFSLCAAAQERAPTPAAVQPASKSLEASREDCDRPEPQRLLHAAAMQGASAVDARAYWLSSRLIQWPQAAGATQPADVHYKLYYSARGDLLYRPGLAIASADQEVTLQRSDAALPAAVQARFKFIADGPRLQVPEAQAAQLGHWLQGQVLLVKEDASGRVLDATALQTPGALDDLYAAAQGESELGVALLSAPRKRPKAAKLTQFKLWAPTAQAVSLCRYANGHSRSVAPAQALSRDDASGVWRLGMAEDLSGQYYSYLVDVWVPGVGVVRNRVTDPYSLSLTTDSKRSYVADLNAAPLKPAGWDRSPRPDRVRAQTDMVIYELHVRDFSINDASVSAPHRGKYLAFTEPQSQGMRHLRALSSAGLTDVHLLPIFDLASVPEAACVSPTVPAAAADSEHQQAAVTAVAALDCFNWGYDPFHYNAPEGSYASDAGDGARRILELRQMVQALHREGLRVGMDVVYNHTAAAGQHPQSVLDRIVPGYYQRLDAKGRIERSTCCDNTATEHAMMAKLMIDSVALWAREYRLDSFRFDLMAHQPRAVMEALQQRVNAAAGRPVQLIGEGWNFGEVANGARFLQASQLSLNGSGIGTFSDRGRDAARGGSAGDSGDAIIQNQGWLNGLVYAPNALAPQRPMSDLMQAADLIRVGLAGSLRDYRMQTWRGEQRRLAEIAYGDQPAGYVSQPGEVVNYVENHDNQTLFDSHALKLPRDTSRHDRARVQLLGAALTAFSQGVAYFHAGQDVLRSKSLDRNSYDSGDWFNRLDWSYQDNHFGSGLPPKIDNGEMYPRLREFLADPSIKPGPADIAWSRDAFRDVLKIRASSTLFRLRSAAEVQKRLHFLNTGPNQNPVLVAGLLEGADLPGAGFKRLLYVINVAPSAQALQLPQDLGPDWALHPVHLAPEAADKRPAQEARWDRNSLLLRVPARTALVLVQP
ncbi:alpha-1,6-glucosidase domain-containing protein [Paucibacter sp. AS339]|uniref:alpha-1,6-glucosidase domain-containing protein n=1 Tax=Paucibacter hankyongi TaxID=3133434 RepID=UPI0030B29D69